MLNLDKNDRVDGIFCLKLIKLFRRLRIVFKTEYLLNNVVFILKLVQMFEII